MGDIKIFQSSKDKEQWFEELTDINFSIDENNQEMQLVMVYSDIRYQKIKGFGGAFTQAAAFNYSAMNEEQQKEFLRSYFSAAGLNYSFGRTHINSCDFSFGNYAYCENEDDLNLNSFSINCEQDYLIPFIQAAKEYKEGKITIIASPWSPPAWMKTNDSMLNGGKLKKEYYALWAEYYVKYIKEYKSKGIEIEMLTVQNEPLAVQNWESCIYTAEEEKIFLRDYLYPALVSSGLEDVKILIWDHNKERLFERARQILSDPETNQKVYGLAFHWYSGDHFENLSLCREFFPDKKLIFTEGCLELSSRDTSMAKKAEKVRANSAGAADSPWEFGEYYAHDIIGNFNSGLSVYLDWNLLLDERGGPNHAENFCSAPIIYDTQAEELRYQPAYCFIGHFSKYIAQGSRKIASSKYTADLEIATFISPEDEKIIVVLNKQDEEIEFTLKDVETNRIADIKIKAKSIMTLIYS
ncbi:glycoside hydrolase family 30 protein [Halanaerobium kushneri]|uniref:Glucosylceramidase n=1 Tax=Halanaerobium kushneri TaxID=56779 RepID=A0A1N6RXU4_9FIRM|nr:glycoside hydrolase family 30 protein [Halanaerobium kushneri]SIQ33668.1 glucosylceramidase [Halanaerobium kushneri]